MVINLEVFSKYKVINILTCSKTNMCPKFHLKNELNSNATQINYIKKKEIKKKQQTMALNGVVGSQIQSISLWTEFFN